MNSLVWNQFENQKSRGIEGFGAFDGERIFKTPKLKKIRGYLKNKKRQTDFLMFHHRNPTSTINVRRAAHPFSTGNYFGDTRYVMVHNGHVSNSYSLKKQHDALGINYTSVLDNGTFNDSEALMWDLSLTLEGKQDKLKAYGGIAFVAVKLVKGEVTHIYFGKNYRSPLNLYREAEGILLSSEGAGDEIKDNTLYTYNYKLNRLTNRYLKVPAFDPDTSWEPAKKTYGLGVVPIGQIPAYSGHWSNYDDDGYEFDYADSRYDDGDSDEFSDPTFLGNTEGIKKHWNYVGKSHEEIQQEKVEQGWWLRNYARVNDDGEVKAYQVYKTYMTMALGAFEDAYDMLDADLDYFCVQGKNNQRDTIIDLISEALDNLYIDPLWRTNRSIDPAYSNSICEQVPITMQEYQQMALAGV